MLRCNLRENKKGEIGETITWVIATIIIVGALLLSVYFTSIMSNFNALQKSGNVFSDLAKESQVLGEKTSFALKVNNIDREKIEDVLRRNNEE